MTTYTAHADTIFDPDKPILGSTHLEARDNLIAALEGASGAPRLSVFALENPTAGDTAKFSITQNVTSVTTATASFNFMQTGTVRVTITKNSGTGTGISLFVIRTRAGSDTTMATGSYPISVDVPVLPGDKITMTGDVVSGTDSATFAIKTAGENLWPGVAGLIIS